MHPFSVPSRVVLFGFFALAMAGVPGVYAQTTGGEQLESAVQRFDEGDFAGAQHLLNQVDATTLSVEERATYDTYRQRAAHAVSMYQKAETDAEAASLAISEGRLDDARRLLRSVVDNEFAPEHTRAAASQELRGLGSGAVQASASPDDSPAGGPDMMQQRRNLRARVLTREADEAVSAGRYGEAERLYKSALQQVPGLPEAEDGLRRVADHDRVESGARELIDRYKERNVIQWQRTVTTFRSVEREIRQAVLSDDFAAARQAMLRARQVLESGKIAADPISRYKALVHDLEALGRYVEDEERRFNESEVSRQRQEARREHTGRQRRIRESKAARISAMMEEAIQHKNDGDYESAIKVLKQVRAVDRGNDNAKWMMSVLEDLWAFKQQRRVLHDRNRETQGVLMDVLESAIPWHEELNYPKNWNEIISRPTRRVPGTEGRSGVDPKLQSKLDQPMRIEFNGDPFDAVIERLADAGGVNISVDWGDLSAASIDPKSPVRLRLNHPVPMGTALREVLDQVSGAHTDLGYLPIEGVVKVATRDRLDRHVFEEVYDVKDLLMPIPNFDDAPSMDINDSLAFARAGDVRSTSSGQAIYPRGYGEYDAERVDEDANQLVSLIRQTIDPDSWRANNGTVGSITEINGQLVITQTPTGHGRIGGLLSKLREQRAIQVAVESRFITVQSNYLEEMGMDLDIILNAGNAGFDFLENPDNRGNTLFDPILGSRLLLPRSFSRVGFTPSTPGVGNALAASSANPLVQPFNAPGLVPQRGNSSGSGTPIPILNNILQITDPGGLTSDLPGSFAGNPTLQPAFSLFGSFLDNIQVDFLVRATQADSRTSLLTAPRLVLFNGQRAWVAVVNQQSFVSSLQPIVNATGQQPLVRTIETGAVLDAQVTVSSDKRYVTMTIRPSVGRLLGIQTFAFTSGANAGEGSFVQLPNISRQVIRTTVTVPDGGTLLVGGQKLAQEIDVESGVPILSKIPIFKRLYSSKTLVKDEQVLLILIKPKILIQSEAEQEAFPTFSQN